MFKLVVLFALLAVAIADDATPIVETPVETPVITARVGEIVENVPTAVSHQSSTVVHSRAAVTTPIVAASPFVYSAAPVAQSYIAGASPLSYTARTAPLAYTAPFGYSAYSAPAVTYNGPSVRYIASPYAYSSYSAPVVHAW